MIALGTNQQTKGIIKSTQIFTKLDCFITHNLFLATFYCIYKSHEKDRVKLQPPQYDISSIAMDTHAVEGNFSPCNLNNNVVTSNTINPSAFLDLLRNFFSQSTHLGIWGGCGKFAFEGNT